MGRIHRYRTALTRHHRSGGHGIHSPFAFNFVLNVLRERLPYYDYEVIAEARSHVIEDGKRHRRPAVMSLKGAKMLYRIANYFMPGCVLYVGGHDGISTLATLLPSSQTRGVVCQSLNGQNHVIASLLQPYADRIESCDNLEQAIESYRLTMAEKAQLPFIVVNAVDDESQMALLRDFIVSLLKEPAVVIIRHLNNHRLMMRLWNDCRAAMTVGHTYTNEKTGIIVTRRDLPLQHFLLWF